ncbi:MAG: ArnT family glycosyltransferase [Candidatus Thermochlorobacter sp.]
MWQYSFIIGAIAFLFFVPFLGAVHLFDWDEINFAESAREMLVTGNYARVQVNFEPFWEKPPLFIWLQALSMHVFGVSEFAARLPNALCGIITLLLLLRIGTQLYNERFGLFWSLSYFGSFLPHFYFKTAIIDPVFNLFIFLGVYCFFRASQLSADHDASARRKFVLLSGACIGLGIMTKGPVALLVSGLSGVIYALISFYRLRHWVLTLSDGIMFGITALLVSALWYGVETLRNGWWFLESFIRYQIGLFREPVAGHGQPFYYHVVVLLFGVFPASFLALGAFRRSASLSDSKAQSAFALLMAILFGVVLTIFSISTTKIVHYSSLCYFPITFFATREIHRILCGAVSWGKLASLACAGFGALVALLLTLFVLALLNVEMLLPFVQDQLVRAVLLSPVEWHGYEWLIGASYFLFVVFSTVLFWQKKFELGFGTLFFSTAMTMHLFTLFIAPKVEAYTQAEPIAFYKSLQDEDCYIVTGYKSYAPYFYARFRPQQCPSNLDHEWLATGPITKPAYFVAKLDGAAWYEQFPELKVIKRSGGYVFFKRDVPHMP